MPQNVLHLISSFTFGVWDLYFDLKKINVINIVRKNKFKRLNSKNNGYIDGICTIIKLFSYFRLHKSLVWISQLKNVLNEKFKK